MIRLPAKPLAPGTASGETALLSSALSLWGGIDLSTGDICDTSHPQRGLPLAGRIMVMEAARGSSSSSSALAESVRRRVNPAGVILARPDPILLIGSLVAAELYGVCIPIVVLEPELWAGLSGAKSLSIRATEDEAEICFEES